MRVSREIRHIVIHCAASPTGEWITREMIDQWHAKRDFNRRSAWIARWNPGLEHIGYHFVIYNNGAVETGRHEDEIGAHVAGSNAHSLGICMVGTDRFTPEQWDALAQLVAEIDARYPGAGVLGHRDYSPDLDGDGVIEPWEFLKTCPGFDVRQWRAGGMRPLQGHKLAGPVA